MGLDDRKDIQSVKLTWSVLHVELKDRVLLPYREITKDIKHTHTHTHTQPLQNVLDSSLV